MIYEDPTTRFYCADCTRQVDEEGEIMYEQIRIDVLGVMEKNRQDEQDEDD